MQNKTSIQKQLVELEYAIKHNLFTYILSIQEAIDEREMTEAQKETYTNLLNQI